MLSKAQLGDISKIQCIEVDASMVDPAKIVPNPHIAFIDGEHTSRAAMSDFLFCRKVVASDGVILFHDYFILHPVLRAICRQLEQEKRAHRALRLDDSVFGIFFDGDMLASDPHRSCLNRTDRHFWSKRRLEEFVKRRLPEWAVKMIRALGNTLVGMEEGTGNRLP